MFPAGEHHKKTKIQAKERDSQWDKRTTESRGSSSSCNWTANPIPSLKISQTRSNLSTSSHCKQQGSQDLINSWHHCLDTANLGAQAERQEIWSPKTAWGFWRGPNSPAKRTPTSIPSSPRISLEWLRSFQAWRTWSNFTTYRSQAKTSSKKK